MLASTFLVIISPSEYSPKAATFRCSHNNENRTKACAANSGVKINNLGPVDEVLNLNAFEYMKLMTALRLSGQIYETHFARI